MPNQHPPIFKALAKRYTDRPSPDSAEFYLEGEAEFVRRMYWRGFVYGLLLTDKRVWNGKRYTNG